MPSSNNPTVLVPRAGARFDWVATVLATIFTGGVFLDGWAHTHGRVDDTFFKPWHAALYAGFLAMALLLVGRPAWGVARHGLPWRRAMPDGYELALAGVACWVVGGPFDAGGWRDAPMILSLLYAYAYFGSGQPSHSQTPRPMTHSRSSPFSHGR